MNICITGAGGFIGKALTQFLLQRGHQITAACRDPRKIGATLRQHNGLTFLPCSLARPPGPDYFRHTELLIHLANDFQNPQHTVNGTIALASAAQEAGVEQQIFVSSLSASPDTRSVYGQTKYTLERFFMRHAYTIIRPGLVMGDGGLFGTMMNTVATHTVIPLIDGGKKRVPLLALTHLVQCFDAILEQLPFTEPINYFYPEMPTMKTLLKTMAHRTDRRTIFIPVPSSILLKIIALFDFLKRPLPLSADSVYGYLDNEPSKWTASPFPIPIPEHSLSSLLQLAMHPLNELREE